MNKEKLIVLKEYDSVNDAEWDKSLLESAGIWSTIQNELMSAIYPTGVMPAQLMIKSGDKAQAEEVLNAYANE
ncbi:MAG: DUF2007 domain-containing protein [Alistipes sp.]|nr:DUF2007 domain-containing protein [Alistipes sp.]